MESTINYGIDLGTTNSTIAKFVKGHVFIYSNPRDYGRNTLPSVVAFRKDLVIVGSKAKERLEKDSKNVVATFKRKMGTSEVYPIKALNQSKTPIELSSLVIKELKTFIPSEERIEAAVITIPASFDTVQSNATKEAGKAAGLKHVVLLQEPIAASLAYANKAKEKEISNGQWLVYDWGGGTFDVALVKIQDGEMKVLDHEGDNFLGGADFDKLIVEKIIIPELEKSGNFSNLEQKMKSASGKYNALFFTALQKAEQAKIELSARPSTEIEIQTQDEDGEEVDILIKLTRSEFESLIKPLVDTTAEMVKKILTRNALIPGDLQFLLMVGGTTFIPFIRRRIEELVQVSVNCDIDPTTAVALGAAYYAGTKPKVDTGGAKEKKGNAITVKMAYQKATKEHEEYFAAKVTGPIEGLHYRIDREDGGFSTGLKPLNAQIGAELTLVADAYNFFKLTIYDAQNNVVPTDAELIGIAQGKYGVSGQPLPNDVCLVVDDWENPGETKTQLVFQKNSLLPLKMTFTKSLNKTIFKGSDDSLIINVLEGSHLSLPEACSNIGYMEIEGKRLSRDVIKGSDIEITVEMSESRELIIAAYLPISDQEFKHIFTPTERHTPVKLLREQVFNLAEKLDNEINDAVEREDYKTAKELKSLQEQMQEVRHNTSRLVEDDVTDERYQLEDRKRKLAHEIDAATRDKRVQIAKNNYHEAKGRCVTLLNESGNDYERKALNDIIQQEPAFINSSSPVKIQKRADELHRIIAEVLWRTPGFLVSIFRDLSINHLPRLNNPEKARNLIEAGKLAINHENWDRLGEVNHALISLLPSSVQMEITNKIGFS